MDPKSLLDAIGNALYQECLIWKYDTSVADDGAGKTHCSLHVTIADPGSTDLVVETVENIEANALQFQSRSAPPALLQICSQTQVDLTESDEPREVGGLTVVTQAMAIDMFLNAFEEHLTIAGGVRASCFEPETPTLKSSTVSFVPVNRRRGREA